MRTAFSTFPRIHLIV
jgi:hypothetical protein